MCRHNKTLVLDDPSLYFNRVVSLPFPSDTLYSLQVKHPHHTPIVRLHRVTPPSPMTVGGLRAGRMWAACVGSWAQVVASSWPRTLRSIQLKAYGLFWVTDVDGLLFLEGEGGGEVPQRFRTGPSLDLFFCFGAWNGLIGGLSSSFSKRIFSGSDCGNHVVPSCSIALKP